MISALLLFDVSITAVVLTQVAVYVPFFAFLVWIIRGKHIRCWWRRRKLHIPSKQEADMRTIIGPTWSVRWVKVSQAKETRPDEVNSTVLGHDLPEIIATLRARYGDEFAEGNIRSIDNRSYGDVLVLIPDK